MRHKHHDELRRWLEAEAAGRLEAAEAALASLFAGVGQPLPPAGFAERVMAVAGFPPVAVVPAVGRELRWPLRAALAACLALVGLLVPALPFAAAVVGRFTGRLTLAGAFDGATSALVTAVRWLAGGLGFWGALARFGGWCAELVASPPLVAVLVTALVAAAVALRLLADLIAHERSWSYVRPS